jgi:coenzyme F420-reducing hydrogenase delta subunit
MSDNFKPKIVAFYCSNCASSAANVADGMNEEGADGVYVAGCQEDSCQYVTGITKAAKRVAHVKEILEQLDIEPERINIYNLSAGKGQAFVDVALEMNDRVRELGPVFSE